VLLEGLINKSLYTQVLLFILVQLEFIWMLLIVVGKCMRY